MPHDTKAGFWDHAVPHDKEASWEAFMSDLVHWLHFRALVASGQVQDGEGLSEQEQAVVTFGQQVQEGQEPLEQQLVLMAGVGRDLLEHSLDRSMAEVAGLVVDGLAAPPFCIPIGALFSKELSTTPDLQEMPEVPSAPVAYPAPPAPTMYDQQLPMCDQQQQAPVPASLWAASARACLRGFDTATAVAHSANATQQQQQQQQDGPPLPVPTETGYQEWGTSFTKNLLAMRFTCCCLGTLIAVGRVVLLPENSCIDKALALGLLLPFTLYHRPKVSLKVTRVFYQILWTFMGLGLYTPMDSNTRIMICLNVEVLVFLFLSSFLEQVRLHELLRERLIFSAVFVVLYQGLQTPHALLRWCAATVPCFCPPPSLLVLLQWRNCKAGQQD
uniref:Uncharacterized protein n=1 Tax=Dunaliella tertiolecta TaxID=3047 RepID=A0A7S3VMF9_DUNTE